MTRDPNSTVTSERRRKVRRKADPSQLSAPVAFAPTPTPGHATAKDPIPTADPDETRRFEQVRQRAYELYMQRGGAPGDDVDDWLAAERQVDAERSG
jgi:DUF2934 family protein